MTFIEICLEMHKRLSAENDAMNNGRFQTREKLGLSAEWVDTTQSSIEKNKVKLAELKAIIDRHPKAR